MMDIDFILSLILTLAIALILFCCKLMGLKNIDLIYLCLYLFCLYNVLQVIWLDVILLYEQNY
jgi:hypothetical protein